ncbi:LysE family translocator [Geminicoccaceae bacterium SYSU G07066]|uniref:LysE family translocator n=2 Tax=Benzoatithermus flavus TaxID=3108223 RepID=A0ABU8XQW3_9PROT
MPEALVAFSLAAALLTMTPGLDTALVLRTAGVEGPRQALLAGLGVCGGCLAWGAAVAVGLGALLSVSEFAYTVLRWAGALYLLWLGWTMLRQARDGLAAEGSTGIPPATGGQRWFVRGLLTNLLNPKVGVFYVTFLPQFLPAGVPATSFMLLLAAVHALLSMVWFAALVAATRPLGRLLRRAAVVRTLDRVTGGVLIAFGLRLALESRR